MKFRFWELVCGTDSRVNMVQNKHLLNKNNGEAGLYTDNTVRLLIDVHHYGIALMNAGWSVLLVCRASVIMLMTCDWGNLWPDSLSKITSAKKNFVLQMLQLLSTQTAYLLLLSWKRLPCGAERRRQVDWSRLSAWWWTRARVVQRTGPPSLSAAAPARLTWTCFFDVGGS